MNKKERDEVVAWMAESVKSYVNIKFSERFDLKKMLDDQVLTIAEVAEKMNADHGRKISKMIARAWLFQLVVNGEIDFATRHIKPHLYDKRSNKRARFVFCDLGRYDRFLENRRKAKEAHYCVRQSQLPTVIDPRPVIRLHPSGPVGRRRSDSMCSS